MAIQKHEYELSIWEKELVGNNTINETKLQVIGAHDMTHLGRATNIHFRKLLNGTHVLTFQMPIRFFNSEVGDYVQNELIENLFNEQKIKLKFKNQWYEMNVKSINEKKNFKSVMKDFTCSDGFIDELSRTGYDIYLDPEANNSVNEIHDFMEETLENSIWDYKPEWNWGDFTEYKEERFYKVPLSLFGGSISAYKLTLDIPDNCLTDKDIKEIENVNNYKKRPIQYGDDLAGVQKCFWNQQDKSGSSLFKNKTTITGDYIYIPMSDLTSIQTYLYENLDSAAQSVETYYNSSLTKYALQPTSNNPKEIIQFLYLPENSTYTIDEGGVLVDYIHTYILTIEDFNTQCKSTKRVYYKDGEGKTSVLTSDVYSLKSFMWKPIYNDGYLSTIGEKEVTKARKVSITQRTELNVYEDMYVNVYNNRVTEQNILPLLPKEITSAAAYKNYRIVSKLDTEIILPTLARNYVLSGKTTTDTTGWESLSKNSGYNIDISSKGFITENEQTKEYKQVDPSLVNGDTNIEFYSIFFNNNGDTENKKGVINFGFIGCEKTIEKDKTYALRIQALHNSSSGDVFKIYTNNADDLKKIIIAQGSLNSEGNYQLSTKDNEQLDFSKIDFKFQNTKESTYILFKSKYTIKNPYVFINLTKNSLYLKSLEIFEAYTRGQDLLEENYIELRPEEDRRTIYLKYKYTGRNIDIGVNKYFQNGNYDIIDKKDLLLETDITLGNTYGKYTYFIQEKKNLVNNKKEDTFLDKEKWFEENNPDFSNTKYVETDFECNTYELNLNQCKYISGNSNGCSHSNNTNKICYYKKYGYCPYLFAPELHPRKIRTLQQSKSNRFNVIQELSKVFEVYPTFTIPHDSRGKVSIKDGKVEKYVHFITEKGNENLVGFRYTKNLTDINRSLTSDNITTKLIVAAVDSQLSDTGYCTIQTARDNLGKNSFIFDFSYYTQKGLLDPEMVEADLYGLNNKDELAYLKRIDIVNSAYDSVKSRINALTDENYKTLKATNDTNLNGITATQEEIGTAKKRIAEYDRNEEDNNKNETYKGYVEQLSVYQNKLYELIEGLFFTDGKCYNINTKKVVENIVPKNFENTFDKDWDKFFEAVENHQYKQCGTVGQEEGIWTQVNNLTKISNSYVKQAKELTTQFNKKYEAFIKEGTWSDSNYLTDNEYYWGGVSLLSDSSKPQTSYNISVIDITKADIDNGDVYEVDLGDITYVEDEDFFGINKETGFANRQKVLISEIDYSLDISSGDRVNVQNYTTQFNDLFQQITASVQSLTYNENIYKRAQSFTPQHYVKTDSLQGTLNTGDLTLLNTNNSIKLNRNGTEGNAIQNSSSKYKLNGDGLFFSTNGGTTWIQAVSPKGLNMDYAKFGAIDVGKIKLVDKGYSYFLWDKNGIAAYNPDITTDYAVYNKYGLTLYQENKRRLRAGYREDSFDEDSPLGFYLYDTNNNTIFSTNSESDISARLTLSGEIYVSGNYYSGKYTLDSQVINNDKPGKLYICHEKVGTQEPVLNYNGKYVEINDILYDYNKGEYTFKKNKIIEVNIVVPLQGINSDDDELWKKFPISRESEESDRKFEKKLCLKTNNTKIINCLINDQLKDYRCYKFKKYKFTMTLTQGNSVIRTHKQLYDELLRHIEDNTWDYNPETGVTVRCERKKDTPDDRCESGNQTYNFNVYYIIRKVSNRQEKYGNSFSLYLRPNGFETVPQSSPEIYSKDITYKDYKFVTSDIIENVKDKNLQEQRLYKYGEEYYKDKNIASSQDSLSSSTAVYINNKNLDKEKDEDTRLISIVKKYKDNNSENIFSITPKGIYIGGLINASYNNLPDEINIIDNPNFPKYDLNDIASKVITLWNEHYPNN